MGNSLRLWGLSLVLVTPLACGGSDDAKTTPPPPSTRSEECTAFQDAACARAERCGGAAARDECYETIRTTFCTSDEAATSCAESLESSACTETVPCGETVIDPGPAIEICNEFTETLCEWAIGCDPTDTIENCRTEIGTRFDCSKAVGVEGDHEVCLDAVKSAPCGELKLPPTCDGMIKVTP